MAEHRCLKEGEIKEIRDIAVETRTSFKFIAESINKIETNHLAHMQASLESLDKGMLLMPDTIEERLIKPLQAKILDPLCTRVDKIERQNYKIAVWATLGAFIGSIIVQIILKYV